MGSYRSNIEEDLRNVEESLSDEEIDSYTWEKLSEKKAELKAKLRECDDD